LPSILLVTVKVVVLFTSPIPFDTVGSVIKKLTVILLPSVNNLPRTPSPKYN
jgi:hypothetical protein